MVIDMTNGFLRAMRRLQEQQMNCENLLTNSTHALKRVLHTYTCPLFPGCQQVTRFPLHGKRASFLDWFCRSTFKEVLEHRYHTRSLIGIVPRHYLLDMMEFFLQPLGVMAMCTSTTCTLGALFGRANCQIMTNLVPS